MNNVFELFSSAAERVPEQAAVEVFRRMGLDTYTYRDVRQLADRTARLLADAGCEAGTRCAILADNDARWCSTYLGILRVGAVAVPLDTSYKVSQVRTVLGDSGARILFTTAHYLSTAQEASAGLTPAPRIVMMAGTTAGLASLDQSVDDDVALLACPATRTDPAVILYTSGTTSDPKGVVLTHGNLLAERDAALQIVTVTEADRILGLLPLFHALAQIANLLMPFTTGARVVFLDTLNSSEMMRALRERQITVFCVVPQFFYLLHQRVVERVAASSWPARVMFRALLVLNGGLRQRLGVNAGGILFRAVHAALGGRMRIMVTGGSRLDPRIGRDLYRMGLNIVQAYGLTECSGAATLARPGDAHIESVGQALAGVEVRVLDDPSDTQTRDHRDGEVLIRGPIVMAGYHNRPDATAASLRDGWLYTGDLGYFDADRRLHITGRKKEIIVLASGKNIYPEEVEAVYAQSPYVADLCVIGVARPDDPSSERLHAIVVPNFDLMRERGIVNTREIVRFDIEGLSLQLPHHKRVLSFDIWRDPLPRTTTRKLRRHEIERLYHERASDAAGPAEQPAWRDEDQAWAAESHVRRVIEVIRAAAKPGAAVTPDASLELDLGLDSMERVELLARLERMCGTPVPAEVAHRIYTVRELVEAIRPAGGAPERGSDATADPWQQILAGDSDDPVGRSILEPRPLFAPLAFVVVKIVYAIAWLLLGFRVTGRGNIPQEGTCLLSPNHQGYLDGVLLLAGLPYRVFRRLFFVGASEYFATPLTAALARLMNIVPVDPDTNLVRAMQVGALGLRHDKILVLFPEGERSPDGTPRTFKKGAAILSTQLGVPIVPVAIHGLFDIWPRGGGFRWRALLPWVRTRSAVRFGDPVRPGPASGAGGDPQYSALTDLLRHEVVTMWKALDEA